MARKAATFAGKQGRASPKVRSAKLSKKIPAATTMVATIEKRKSKKANIPAERVMTAGLVSMADVMAFQMGHADELTMGVVIDYPDSMKATGQFMQAGNDTELAADRPMERAVVVSPDEEALKATFGTDDKTSPGSNIDHAEAERLELLDRAVRQSREVATSTETNRRSFRYTIFIDTVALLGGAATVGQVKTENDLLKAIQRGFSPTALEELQEAGIPVQVLETVVAPKRTLARRRSEKQRLTMAESDACWRLAHVMALAEDVLADRRAALEWLSRPKPSLGGNRPFDLVETSVGSDRVEMLLQRLEWGMV